MSIKSIIILFLTVLSFSIQKDPSTFSNYDQIVQKSLEGNYNIDFDKSVIVGKLKIYFTGLKDGDYITLDTKNLKIISVIDSNTGDELEWILDSKVALESLGTPLRITRPYKKDEQVPILINYETLPSSSAIQWLKPELTVGQKYPYMFTQCEPILCRQLLPCQDTPNAKVTVSTSITVKKPLVALNSGIFQSKIENAETTTYFYTQKIPIPSYLIAIAAGNIEGRKISERTTVYSEPEVVDKAAVEFSDTETFIQNAETYTIPYEWGEYNILILPPSFPFGGMENPCLTFATPSIIAGDKSLADVIAHEISHSWSGNLVTMSTWTDFWLNEGFTMFLERKIIEKVFGKDMAQLSALVGYKDYKKDVYGFGEYHDYTALRPHLTGTDPDDAFSTIPYEKGFNLLYFLEQLVNEKAEDDFFKLILRRYFTKYKYEAISYYDFREFFEAQVTEKFGPEVSQEIFNQIDWDNWVIETGFPNYTNNFTNPLSLTCDERVEQFFNNQLPSGFKAEFQGWHSYAKGYFLKSIKDDNKGNNLSDSQFNLLKTTLGLGKGYNAEVSFDYFHIMLNNKKLDDLENLDTFLGTYGRMRYIKPLFVSLAQFNKAKALELFNKHKSFYHPIAIRAIEIEFRKLK